MMLNLNERKPCNNIFIMFGGSDNELDSNRYFTKDDQSVDYGDAFNDCDEIQQITIQNDSLLRTLSDDENTYSEYTTTTRDTPISYMAESISATTENIQNNDSSSISMAATAPNTCLLIKAIRENSSPTLNDQVPHNILARVVNESFPQLSLEADNEILGKKFLEFIDEQHQLQSKPAAVPSSSIRKKPSDPNWHRMKKRPHHQKYTHSDVFLEKKRIKKELDEKLMVG